jgi:hypothetical protein
MKYLELSANLTGIETTSFPKPSLKQIAEVYSDIQSTLEVITFRKNFSHQFHHIRPRGKLLYQRGYKVNLEVEACLDNDGVVYQPHYGSPEHYF